MTGRGVEILGPGDAARVADIWNAAQPSEPLTTGEVATVLQHDPGLVLASADGVIAATFHGDRGHVRLLAVTPGARRQGQGRALLTAAEQWLATQGATTIRWGAEIPYYLWPGVDRQWTAAMALAIDCGYSPAGTAVNMTIGTRLEVPRTLPIERVAGNGPWIEPTRRLVQDNWAPWLTEVDLAAEQGTLFVAVDGEVPVAFMAHSTLRRGWLGPMGTAPSYQGRGIGTSVLHATCADLSARGFATAEIAWVGPTDYFARMGAIHSRTFVGMVKALPSPDPATADN